MGQKIANRFGIFEIIYPTVFIRKKGFFPKLLLGIPKTIISGGAPPPPTYWCKRYWIHFTIELVQAIPKRNVLSNFKKIYQYCKLWIFKIVQKNSTCVLGTRIRAQSGTSYKINYFSVVYSV